MLALLELIAVLLCAILAALGIMLLNHRSADGTAPNSSSTSGGAMILIAIIGALALGLIHVEIRQAMDHTNVDKMISDLGNAAKGS